MTIFHKPKIIIPIAAIIALAIGIVFFNRVGRAPTRETEAVTIADVSGDIVLGGTVEAATPVELAFAQGGRVASVKVKEGQQVHAGEILATLDAGTALGAVTQAKAALDLAKAQRVNTGESLETATAQQDVLVKNAYRTLLSSALQAVPDEIDESNNPTISGTYTCDREGAYTITPYPSSADSGYSFRYSGLENGIAEATFNIPQPLGACGLFITFTPNFSGSTVWTISIPNTKSASYVMNKNAYDAAVATRAKTLADISATLSGKGNAMSAAEAGITAAEGAYQAALGAYQNTIITAPIDGTVSFASDILKVGQTIQPGVGVLNISPENSYQIESYLSSDDAPKAQIGAEANISFADGRAYRAVVVSRTLAPSATGSGERYRVIFSIVDADHAIAAGASASVRIAGEKKSGVLSIPRSALITSGGAHSVLVAEASGLHAQDVTVGSIGSDRVEILSGLTEGQSVVVQH